MTVARQPHTTSYYYKEHYNVAAVDKFCFNFVFQIITLNSQVTTQTSTDTCTWTAFNTRHELVMHITEHLELQVNHAEKYEENLIASVMLFTGIDKTQPVA